ncbi:MAG: beta strand repeat-containing protein, partial [Limisphaerales bacterium]
MGRATRTDGSGDSDGINNWDSQIYKIDRNGNNYANLHFFTYTAGGIDYNPLLPGRNGNLYGVTGGDAFEGDPNNLGTVFMLTPSGTYTDLRDLSGSDGTNPDSGLIEDTTGHLYGTAAQGGAYTGNGGGTAFSIGTNGQDFTVIHNFGNGHDGAVPSGRLLLASDGYLYGTTIQGGTNGYGTIFRMATNGSNYKEIYAFTGNVGASGDHGYPNGCLSQSSAGVIYGMTSDTDYDYDPAIGNGTIFSLTGVATAGATIQSVTSSPTANDYKTGTTVRITITFSAAVTVTGTPQLALSDGGTANYASGSGTATLTFDYVVSSGDNSQHLDYASTSALSLNGGTIDSSGSPATLTLPAPGAAGSLSADTTIIIDTVAPVVTIGAPSVLLTKNGPAAFTVTWSDTNLKTSSIALSALTVYENLNKTGTAAFGEISVTSLTNNYQGSGNTVCQVILSSLSGTGTIGFTIPTGSAEDLATNSASSATSQTFAVDNTPPTVTISPPSVTTATIGGSVSYTVSYFSTNFASATLTAANITLTNPAVTGTITVTPNNSTNFTATVANLAGGGAQAMQIAAGTATDTLGNSSAAAGPSASFAITPTVTGISPTLGPATGSTSVTITGTGFASGATVRFGTTVATGVTVVNSTTITATSPTGPGLVDVTVTVGSQTSATSPADQFTYLQAPTVTGISPTVGPAAGGTSVTIAGTSFTGATTVKFGTAVATSLTVVSPTQITAISPAGAGTADVTVTAGGQTSATSAADQFTYTPNVTGISPASGVTLGDTFVTITGTGFATGATVMFGATAATSVTVANPTTITAVSPAGTGTVDVTVTADSQTSATGAADQFTYTAPPNFDLYVGNFDNNTISTVSSNGTVSTFVPNTNGLNFPKGLALDSAGNLYVANFGSNTISEVTPGGTVSAFASGLSQPAGLAFDSAGNLYVANFGSDTISEVTPGGTVSTFASGLSQPAGLAFDSAGNLYVANFGSGTISKVTPGGAVSTFVSGLSGPLGLAIGAGDNLYVANFNSGTISKVTPSGAVSTFATGLNSPFYIAIGAPPPIVVTSVSSSPAAAFYIAGETVPITITFSAAVTVTGTPQLALSDGGTADYVSGSGTAILTFDYVVSAGDNTQNLDYASTGALTLNGGTIELSGTPATLTLPTPGAAGSLRAHATIVIDTVAPVATIGAPSVSLTKSGPVTFLVTWSDENLKDSSISLTALDVFENLNKTGTAAFGSISLTAVTNLGSTATAQVIFASLSGTGTIGFTIPAGSASDLAGNSAGSDTSQTFNVDNTQPTVAISAPSVAITNGGSVTYTVTFSDPYLSGSSLLAASVTISQTGTAAAASITVTPGSGNSTSTNYLVTLSGLSGHGTLDINIPAGAATDTPGNTSAAAASGTFVVDTTLPTVSFTAPSVAITNGGSITYTVTFTDHYLSGSSLPSASVTTSQTGTAAAASIVVAPGTGTTISTNYLVTLSGLSGNGTLDINIPAGAATDTAGNNSAAATSGTFIVDTTLPTVTFSAPSVAITNGGSVTYTVTFTDPYLSGSSLLSASLTTGQAGTAAATSIVVTPGTGTTTSTNYLVTLSGLSGNGTLDINIPAGAATDTAGNNSAAAVSGTFIVDTTLPTVAISAPSESITNGGSVSYMVTFSDPYLSGSALLPLSIATNSTGTASLTNIAVTPGTGTATSTNYLVTLSGLAGNGTIGITIPAGAAFDTAGNSSAAAVSGTFTVDTTLPPVTISAPSVAVTNSGSVSYTVTFSAPYLSGSALPPLAIATNSTGTA